VSPIAVGVFTWLGVVRVKLGLGRRVGGTGSLIVDRLPVLTTARNTSRARWSVEGDDEDEDHSDEKLYRSEASVDQSAHDRLTGCGRALKLQSAL